jgi:hypothetical protein
MCLGSCKQLRDRVSLVLKCCMWARLQGCSSDIIILNIYAPIENESNAVIVFLDIMHCLVVLFETTFWRLDSISVLR